MTKIVLVLILAFMVSPLFAQVQAISKLADSTILVANEDRLLEIGADRRIHPVKYTGLQNPVQAIARGKKGEMWLATENELLRCEKRNCQPTAVKVTEIRSLAVDDQNRLWIGTRNGLFRLDQEGATSSPVPMHMVEAVTADSEGSLWIASGFEITRRKNNGETMQLSLPPPPPNVRMGPPVTSILVTSAGQVYVGTHGGLFVLKGTKFVKDTEDEVLALAQDDGGNLWMGSSKGLKKHSNNRWSEVTLPQ